jgi:hypothetical protein
LAYLAAIMLLAWPLPRALGRALVDPVAMVWILAWGAHGLVTQPLHVFDGNICYPASNALASSEHLLGLAPVSAPIFLLTGNAVLTYNVTLILVVLVTAIGTFLLAREWGADALSAWVAGATLAFAPMNLAGWTGLHTSAVQFFPLILLLAWRAAARPRRDTLFALGRLTALQGLAGVYVAFEFAVLLASMLPVLWWRAHRHGRSGVPLLVALGVGALPLLPVALIYHELQVSGVLPAGSNPGLASIAAALTPTFLANLLQTNLGWSVLMLAALGVFWRASPASGLVRVGLVSMAALGFWFALGPNVAGPYALASWLVPGFGGMRAPMRFLIVTLLALACAAGLGAAALRSRLAARLGVPIARGALVLACAIVVVAHRPAGGLAVTTDVPSASARATHSWLAANDNGRPILVLPAYISSTDIRGLLATTEAMVGSTAHWQPLVNGYSGYLPPSHRLLMTIAQRLPDRHAFEDLCRLVAPGWLLVRTSAVESDWLERARRLPMEVAFRHGDDLVLRTMCPEAGALLPALRRQVATGDDGQTLLGLDRRTLAREARRGTLRPAEFPTRFGAGLLARLWIDVEHQGRDPWPGLSAWPSGTVGLQARWRSIDDGAVIAQGLPVGLARDLLPGETMRAQVEVPVPSPGRYDLEVGLVRRLDAVASEWFADEPGGTGLVRRRVITAPFGRRPVAEPTPR